MLIEIKGVQFENKGAELMLYSIVKEVKQLWPEAEICLRPRLKSPYVKRASLGAYQKLQLSKGNLDLNALSYWLPKKIKNYLKRAWGIVTESDVSIVLDASGFSYGEQWGESCLDSTVKEVQRLKKHNKGYIFLPQALGPFKNSSLHEKAKLAFGDASLVFARESCSFEHVKDFAQNNVLIAPDFTNLYSPQANEQYHHLSGGVAIIVNCKMISEKNKDSYWRENYITNIVQLVSEIQHLGKNVFLLNHEGAEDRVICEQLSAQIGEIEIVEPDHADDVKGIIKQCEFVVSSRFHGCVSALSSNIPCLATSWSHKYEQLYKEYGVSECLIDKRFFDGNLNIELKKFYQNLPNIKVRLEAATDKYQSESKLMWQKVYSVVDELCNQS